MPVGGRFFGVRSQAKAACETHRARGRVLKKRRLIGVDLVKLFYGKTEDSRGKVHVPYANLQNIHDIILTT